MAFADKLKQRREEQKLTQEDVAGLFNDCSRQAVSNWERGVSHS
ncbi:MAG: helix-turn-helix transcriptional regulator [Lachnospiraceae bacterium]